MGFYVFVFRVKVRTPRTGYPEIYFIYTEYYIYSIKFISENGDININLV